MVNTIQIKKYGFTTKIVLIGCTYIVHFLNFIYLTNTQIYSITGLLIFVDLSHLICLKNYFLFYTFLIFVIGGGVFYPDENMDTYFLWYSTFFMIGYLSFFITNIKKSSHYNNASNQRQQIIIRNNTTKRIFLILIFLNILLVLITILQTGSISNYLQGASLVSKIEDYRKKDIGLGILTIIQQAVSIVSMVCFVIFVRDGILLNKKNIFVVILFLVGLPLIALSRSQMSFNLVFSVLIYSIYGNRKGQFNFLHCITLVFILSIVVFFGSTIGGIRDKSINGVSSTNTSDLILISLAGELSPIIMYRDIVTDHKKLGLQYGKTIIFPLLLKIIPSNIYPEKPDNTVVFYSKKYSPDAYERGMMLASTIFTDLYLNFGFVGTLIIITIIGLLIGYTDNIYFSGNINNMSFFLICYSLFYSFLRNNLSNSLSTFFLTIIVYKVFTLYLKRKTISEI